MRRRDNSKPSIEIPREAEEKPFDFDSMPWVDEYDYYPRINSLRSAFGQFDMVPQVRQFPRVSWVLWALKPAGEETAADDDAESISKRILAKNRHALNELAK